MLYKQPFLLSGEVSIHFVSFQVFVWLPFLVPYSESLRTVSRIPGNITEYACTYVSVTKHSTLDNHHTELLTDHLVTCSIPVANKVYNRALLQPHFLAQRVTPMIHDYLQFVCLNVVFGFRRHSFFRKGKSSPNCRLTG